MGSVSKVTLKGKEYGFLFPTGGNIISDDVILIMDNLGNPVPFDEYDDLCIEFDESYYIDEKTGEVLEKDLVE